jgi:dTMP kinase
MLRGSFRVRGGERVTIEERKGEMISVGAPGAIETAQVAASGGYRRLFENRSFRNMWIAQAISGVGDWLVIGLLIPLVSALAPGSSLAVAGILIAKIIPSLIMGTALGVLVDRFDRRRLMIVCDLANGALCLALIAATTGMLPAGMELFLIYAITFVMEIANLLFFPAKNALIPLIVEDRDLASANGLSYTTQQASMLVGLVASGAIIAAFAGVIHLIVLAGIPLVSKFVGSAPQLAGPQGGIVLDFISFMISASLVTSIKSRQPERTERALDLRLIGRDVVESWELLRSRGELRAFLASAGIVILGAGALLSVGFVYVQQNLVGGIPFLDLVPPLQRVASQAPQTFTFVFLALGMFLGAIVVPRIAERTSLERLLVSGFAGIGISMLGFSLTNVYWVGALFCTGAGFFIAQSTVAGNTFVADTVQNEVRGRVFAALESVIRVAMLASIALTAPVGDLIGSLVRAAFTGTPAYLYLTGSRMTLIFASAIVLGGALYAAIAVDWRSKSESRNATRAERIDGGGADGDA